MSRLGGAFWFLLVIATGATNFLVKQTVQSLDDQLTQVRRKTTEDQKKIHDLTADWTFLTQPELLADLNNRYVHLTAMSPKQVVTNLDGIPMRPAPPPQETAPPAVAEVLAPAPAPAVTSIPIDSPAPTQVAAASPQAAARAPTVPVATPGATHAPAEPLSLISTAHAATATAAAPPSLDGIFAQVAGNR
jgi:hypothetical protein